VLYVGNFGGEKVAPAEKDGLGYSSKAGLDGKVIEERIFPAKDGEKMNKPKGTWIRGDRLWVTDIDAVWIFDLRSKKAATLALRDVAFANDPAVMGNALYITDNRNDKLVKVEPADFLNAKEPKVTEVLAGRKLTARSITGAKPAASSRSPRASRAPPTSASFRRATAASRSSCPIWCRATSGSFMCANAA
jgi:hypothetical protein